MGVLALDVRTLGSAFPISFLTALCGREHVTVAAVHRARHIAPLAVALVVGDAAGVERFDGLHDVLEVVAASALVAGTPSEDAGMIAKGADVSLVALHHRLSEELHAGEASISVAFDVGFSKDIEPVLIAQFVEIGVVGIVACADCVDVEPFHGQHVLKHLFAADGPAVLLTDVVTINAMNHKTFPVDEQSPVITDADRAEAYLAGSHIDQFSLGRKQAEGQVIELGMFRAPAFDARKRDALGDAGCRGKRFGVFLDNIIPVAEGHLQPHALCRSAFQRDLQAALSRCAGR